MLRGLAVAVAVSSIACLGEIHPDPDGVPDQYAGRANPYDGDAAAIDAGAALYARHCVRCHGPFGLGDGPGGEFLDPRPPNFHDVTLDRPDDYLYWRIAEGGAGDPVDSDMPAWKLELYEQEIWQVISYLRSMR